MIIFEDFYADALKSGRYREMTLIKKVLFLCCLNTMYLHGNTLKSGGLLLWKYVNLKTFKCKERPLFHDACVYHIVFHPILLIDNSKMFNQEMSYLIQCTVLVHILV